MYRQHYLNFYFWIGIEKWDDGNTQNGDGWSSLWTIEMGYTWSIGANGTKDICNMIEQKASAQQTAATSTQTAVGVGASVSAGASLLSMTSPIGIFSMINQYQLLQLLLISGAYISLGVSNLITGMKVSIINLDFIKIEKIWIIENINNYFSSEQSNENLSNIGINSGSTIVNLLKLFWTIILIVLLHLVFLRFYVRWK